MVDLLKIIDFYQSFDIYKNYTYAEIFNHIYPSLKNQQFKAYHDEKGIYGFANWALFDDINEKYFLETYIVPSDGWDSGSTLYFIDLVASRKAKQVILDQQRFMTKKFGLNRKVKWIRFHEDKRILKEFETKKHYLNNWEING